MAEPGFPEKKGFSGWILALIAGACAVPLLAIVAAIVIPGLLASRRSANERTAAATLKVVAAAEIDFRARDRDGNGQKDFWVADLASLHFMSVGGRPLALIDEALAQADAGSPPGGPRAPRSGYWYHAVQLDAEGKPYDAGSGRNPLKFAFCAYPASPSAGRTIFIVNEDLAIWRNQQIPMPLKKWPRDLRAEGWIRLD